MIIDIAFAIVIVFAIFKGFTKGLILGIFSFFAFMIGLAAALKLSAVVAEYLKHNASAATKWLPLFSFIIVFVAVILLVNVGARLIRRTLRFAMLGWIDRLGGMILYIFIYIIVFSIFLFFAEKLFLIGPATIRDSQIYPYIAPWGPKVINNIGSIIPFFNNIFSQLQDFFGGIANKHHHNNITSAVFL